MKVALNIIIPYLNPNGVHLISFYYKFISNIIIDQLFKFYVDVNITSVHSCVSGINDLRPMSILWRIEFSLSFDKYSISWSPCENMSLYICLRCVAEEQHIYVRKYKIELNLHFVLIIWSNKHAYSMLNVIKMHFYMFIDTNWYF